MPHVSTKRIGSFDPRVCRGRDGPKASSVDAMLLARRTLGKFSPPLSRSRRLSSRASAVLGALDIPTTPIELPGVYDGEWKGSGDVFQSVCPATGEVLAHVKSVSLCVQPVVVFDADCRRAARLITAIPTIPTPHRHLRRSSMAHWRGRGTHTYTLEAYLRPREAR